MPISLSTSTMSDPIRLTLSCRRCHRPMTVMYQLDTLSELAVWTCPYADCGTAHVRSLRGTVTAVQAGWNTRRSELERLTM